MSNQQFKIADEASIFNIKRQFNEIMDRLAEEGKRNYVRNPGLEFEHKNLAGNTVLDGWEMWDESASLDFEPVLTTHYTQLEDHTEMYLDAGDRFHTSLSNRIHGITTEKFILVIRMRASHPVSIRLSTTDGFIVSFNSGSPIGHHPDTYELGDAFDWDNTTIEDLPYIQSTVVANERIWFIDDGEEFVTLSIPFEFNTPTARVEDILIDFYAHTDSTVLDVKNVVLKEGQLDGFFPTETHHFIEHVRYNLPEGIWEIDDGTGSWFQLLTAGAGDSSHAHTSTQITDWNAALINSLAARLIAGNETTITSVTGTSITIGISNTFRNSVNNHIANVGLHSGITDTDPAATDKIWSSSKTMAEVASVIGDDYALHVADLDIHNPINDAIDYEDVGDNGAIWSAEKIGDHVAGQVLTIGAQFVPAGTIVAWPTDTLPGAAGDWLVCDGATYAAATYADLYSAIAEIYGNNGNPGTEFQVPDYRGQFLRGWDAAGGLAANEDQADNYTFTGTVTNDKSVIIVTNNVSPGNIFIGQLVTGANIPVGSRITKIGSRQAAPGTNYVDEYIDTIQISNVCTGGASGITITAINREDRGDGTTGNTVGTRQLSSNAAHKHELRHNTTTHLLHRTTTTTSYANPTLYTDGTYDISGEADDILWEEGTQEMGGALETRPKNVTVMYIIKA